MAQARSCAYQDRSGSPDAPDARLPTLSSPKKRVVCQYNNETSAMGNSLTPSDRIELAQRVGSLHSSYKNDIYQESFRRPSVSPSRFACAVKKRLSQGTTFIQQTPTKLRSKISRRFSLSPIRRRIGINWPGGTSKEVSTSNNASSDFDADARVLENVELHIDIPIPNPLDSEIRSNSDSLRLESGSISSAGTSIVHELARKKPNDFDFTCMGKENFLERPTSNTSLSEHSTAPTIQTNQSLITPCRISKSVHGQATISTNEQETPTKDSSSPLPQAACDRPSLSPKIELRYEPIDLALMTDIWDISFLEDLGNRSTFNSSHVNDEEKSNDKCGGTRVKTGVLPAPQLDCSLLSSESKKHTIGIERTSSSSSVHLYNMRISQHLRSFSGFSGQSNRSVSPQGSNPDQKDSEMLHTRESSSGFSSTKVPASWGKVVRKFQPEVVMLENHGPPRIDTFPQSSAVSKMPYKKSIQKQNSVDVQKLRLKGGARNADDFQAKFIECLNTLDRLDGISDLNQGTDLENPYLQPPRSESVRENYNETSIVWGKAFRGHQEDRLNPQRSRTSSFGSMSRRSSRSVKQSSHGSRAGPTEQDHNDTDPSNMPRIELKRVDTSHSFDLMTMPGRFSSTSPPSTVSLGEGLHNSIESRAQRLRSISQPPDNGAFTPAGSTHLLAPSLNLRKKISLALNISGMQSKEQIASIRGRGPKRISNLSIWSRFPSHTREERNGPAGIADNVIVRDFQPFEVYEGGGSSEAAKEVGAKQTTKSKWRTRLKMFRGKYLTDLSALLKNRTGAGFRRREHGHRSSISVGGVLEYPELELLPRSEPQLPPAIELIEQQPPMCSLLVASKSHEADGRRVPQSNSRLGSSNYTSDNDANSSSNSPTAGRLTSAALADIYGQYVDSNKTQSIEEVPLLHDFYPGQVSRHDGCHEITCSAVAGSGMNATDIPNRANRIHERALRRSTQDLLKTLEASEAVEVARTLRTAETFE